MNKNKIFIMFGIASMLSLFSCKDEELAPILTFDQVGKGAYVRLLSETTRNLNLFDLTNESYTYSVDFVDLDGGNLVSEYKIEFVYEDNNPDISGDKSAGPTLWKTFSSGEFTQSEEGFKGISSITITGNDLLGLFSLTLADVGPGDKFKVKGSLTTTDGAVFTAGNSSASVNGAGFRGHFDFTLSPVCPSDIAGSYAYTTTGMSTDGCCPNQTTVEGTITLTDLGNGNYTISDWSGGLYREWYDVYGITPDFDLSLTVTDVCNGISSGVFTEPFGETANLVGTRDPDSGVITYSWENGYGDMGTVTLTP